LSHWNEAEAALGRVEAEILRRSSPDRLRMTENEKERSGFAVEPGAGERGSESLKEAPEQGKKSSVNGEELKRDHGAEEEPIGQEPDGRGGDESGARSRAKTRTDGGVKPNQDQAQSEAHAEVLDQIDVSGATELEAMMEGVELVAEEEMGAGHAE